MEAENLLPLAIEDLGPRATRSLRSRALPLASPLEQLALLDALPLAADLEPLLARAGLSELLRPKAPEILQLNVGRLCNMSCRHCHVDAGPDRADQQMSWETMQGALALLDRLPSLRTVDITGGAPELNPHFQRLVAAATERGRHVIDRCNLTILLSPRFADLPAWLGERGVELVCSLPHARARNTDAQRGEGTFARSMEALRRCNAAGYGQGDPRRVLTLMHNPAGAWLPGAQAAMEREWKEELARREGVRFDRLIALNNMPIARFLEWLVDSGNLEPYMARLLSAFNPATVAGLMCRDTLSVAWDGSLYDCDFNQQLELPLSLGGRRPHLAELDDAGLAALLERRIVTARHCLGCTAGAGSSCGGATV